jgi:hypothetical protein
VQVVVRHGLAGRQPLGTLAVADRAGERVQLPAMIASRTLSAAAAASGVTFGP